MQISRRGLILGGSALLAGCTSTTSTIQSPPPAPRTLDSLLALHATPDVSMGRPVLDPHGIVRPDLISRAQAALDQHQSRIARRDRLYVVDFQKFSGDERLYEVDLEGGWVTAYRTTHGRGSDPRHSGYAERFSNELNSHMSSLGAFATAGAGWGPQQGPNVLLDGLEHTNDRARERAIIIHGADYADPAFLASQGKLGRSYGCFSVSHADLVALRQRMGEGRLLFAMT